MLLIPAPAVIFSGCNAVPSDLSMKFDSIVMLEIYNNYKGKALVEGLFQVRQGFAGIVLNLLTILALWYGFTSLPTRQYFKFLCRFRSQRLVFWSVVIARLLLFSSAFLVINGFLYAFARARGIVFSASDHIGIMGNLAAALVMLAVFFAVGVFFGKRGTSALSYILLFIAWYVLVFAIPGAMGAWAEKKLPDTIDDYQTELDNFETIVKFEIRAEAENKKFNRKNIVGARKIIKGFIENDYPKIHAHEGELKKRIESTIDTLSGISILCPTTFYMSSSNEMSSLGYLNFIAFYQYGREMKKKFVLFYIDRTYYHDPKVVVCFIKGNEDIFICSSRLPHYFLPGILLHLFYAAAILFFAYLRSGKWLFPSPKKPGQFNRIDINILKGRIITFSVDRIEFINQLENAFFGKLKKLSWKIIMAGIDITTGLKREFAYLVNPRHLPGELKPIHLLSLFKRLLNLTNEEMDKIINDCGKNIMEKYFSVIDMMDKAGFLLALVEVRTPGIIVFNAFTEGIPGKSRGELAERVEKLAEKGALIIDIVCGESYWLEPDTRVTAAFDDCNYKVLTNS